MIDTVQGFLKAVFFHLYFLHYSQVTVMAIKKSACLFDMLTTVLVGALKNSVSFFFVNKVCNFVVVQIKFP